ncbi:MAG: chromosome segregation protein SMC [Nitrospirota bacterium]
MYLKRLHLLGFKSFFDKTIVEFKPGITAIVGPNGCGKSNLIDAILWVLGEQRPKSLRGEKMEDVIFNGTEHRKPLGMAEVSLTLGDISEPLPSPYSPYSEITFTRRLFRSGESEYLINQAPCRLKDIRELLIDFRAGYRVHTVIEQGRIDELLSASPAQRREFVEEAANLAKYRLRKDEAIRKLEATDRNLLRIQDVLSEVKRQVNALDRQARAAQKYQHIYEELKTDECQIAVIEWSKWKKTEEALSIEDQSLQTALLGKEAEEGSYTLKISTHRLALSEKEQALSQQKDKIAQVDGTIGRAEGIVERIRAQKKEWTETRGRTTNAISDIEQEASAGLAQQEQLQAEEQKTEESFSEIQIHILKLQEEIAPVQAVVLAKTRELELERTEGFQVASRVTESRNNLVHFDARRDTLLKKKEADMAKASEIDRQKEIAQKRLETLQGEWTETERKTVENQDALNKILISFKLLEKQQEENQSALYKVKEEWARALADLASKEGFYRGLLSPAENSLHLEGPFHFVADIIRVSKEYEKAIEAALGDRLRGMVVEALTHLKDGVKQLQERKTGRGTFILRQLFPEQSVTALTSMEGKVGAALDLISYDGMIGAALDLVSCKEGYDDVTHRLLEGVFVVRDLDTAFELLESRPAFHPALYVTLQGETISPSGVVSAGFGTQLLEQRRERDSLSEQTALLQSEVERLEVATSQSKAKQRETVLEIEQFERALREITIKRTVLQKEMNTLTLENDKIQMARQTFLFDQETEGVEEAAILQKREKELLVISVLEKQKEESNRRFSKTALEREAIEFEKKKMQEQLVSLQLQSASLKEKRQAMFARKEQMTRTASLLQGRKEAAEKLLMVLAEKWASSEEEEIASVIEIEKMAALRSDVLELIRQKMEDQDAAFAIMKSLESDGKKSLLEKNQITTMFNEVSVRKLEAQMSSEKVRETLLIQYQIEIATLALNETAEALPQPISLDEMWQKRDRLRSALATIGPVHLGAIEEYQGLTERHDFLKTQEEDLVRSTKDLNTAIEKINQTTKGLFIETFNALNSKFGETFISFFGGGRGELILTEPSNPLESGIEIVVAPPGKRAKSISLLSGGEKALTALSLLFATFLNQPAPFCVLDEVDAPLDDENTRRFSLAIERLSEQTQFMVITHNKRTMEKADILYGVTAEELGVSKLISVSLKTLTGAAAHGGPTRTALSLPAATEVG